MKAPRELPNDPVIIEAAQWLADTPEPQRPIIPHLQQRFGLRAAQACEAIYLAGEMRLQRRVHG